MCRLEIEMTFPNGDRQPFAVEGIFDPPTGGSPFGYGDDLGRGMGRAGPAAAQPLLVPEDGGRRDRREPGSARGYARRLPEREGPDPPGFIDNQISGLNSILNILYVLLALSIIVSLFGIVNTLVLTVFERTREIGMLRAIGMTRRQIRRMIRHESVITALIGAAIGILLGIVLAALLICRVDFIAFSFPTTQVIVFVIAAIVVGILAAIFPARRAAKLDPLEAIAYEVSELITPSARARRSLPPSSRPLGGSRPCARRAAGAGGVRRPLGVERERERGESEARDAGCASAWRMPSAGLLRSRRPRRLRPAPPARLRA